MLRLRIIFFVSYPDTVSFHSSSSFFSSIQASPKHEFFSAFSKSLYRFMMVLLTLWQHISWFIWRLTVSRLFFMWFDRCSSQMLMYLLELKFSLVFTIWSICGVLADPSVFKSYVIIRLKTSIELYLKRQIMWLYKPLKLISHLFQD